MTNQQILVKMTANDTREEEMKFRQEEINDSISDILAREKQRESIPKLLKEIFE
jgi:hypothetical protein